MPSSVICVGASLVVRRFTAADDAPVQELWKRWAEARTKLVAPHLLRYEVAHAFHRLTHTGLASTDDMRDALNGAMALPIELVTDDELRRRALALAERFNRRDAYHTHYLALAERLGIEFWTADKRLVNAVRAYLPWVHLAGE